LSEYWALPLRSRSPALGRREQVEQRVVQRAVLRLEMAERLVVDGRDQQQAVPVRVPKLEVDVHEPVDGFGRRPLDERADGRDRSLEDRIKNVL
jgi:hypothetical protein